MRKFIAVGCLMCCGLAGSASAAPFGFERTLSVSFGSTVTAGPTTSVAIADLQFLFTHMTQAFFPGSTFATMTWISPGVTHIPGSATVPANINYRITAHFVGTLVNATTLSSVTSVLGAMAFNMVRCIPNCGAPTATIPKSNGTLGLALLSPGLVLPTQLQLLASSTITLITPIVLIDVCPACGTPFITELFLIEELHFVPEPSTLALLSLGLGIIYYTNKRPRGTRLARQS